jgi:hypothetical protein
VSPKIGGLILVVVGVACPFMGAGLLAGGILSAAGLGFILWG